MSHSWRPPSHSFFWYVSLGCMSRVWQLCKGALSTTAQLASRESLPILKIISLRCRLETPSPLSFSSFSVNLVPKSLSSSLHSFTKHSASTSSPIVTKALLPTLSLCRHSGGGSSTSAQLPWLSL